MGVNSLPKTVTRQRRGSDLNPGPAVPESSRLTIRLLGWCCELRYLIYFRFMDDVMFSHHANE